MGAKGLRSAMQRAPTRPAMQGPNPSSYGVPLGAKGGRKVW